MPSFRVLFGVGLVLLVVGCDEPAGPKINADGLRRIEPQPSYSSWWAEAQGCTGITASMDRITWWLASRLPGSAVGVWVAPHDIVFLPEYHLVKTVVQHEMVHDLLQQGEDAHQHRCFESLRDG